MQISAISSAYSSYFPPITHAGAVQNLPVAGNSNPASQTSGPSAPTTLAESGAITPSRAYALASQVAGEFSVSGTGLHNDEQSAQLSGRAAAAAAGLASSGNPMTMSEVTAAVRSYMDMHGAASPQPTSGVSLIA